MLVCNVPYKSTRFFVFVWIFFALVFWWVFWWVGGGGCRCCRITSEVGIYKILFWNIKAEVRKLSCIIHEKITTSQKHTAVLRIRSPRDVMATSETGCFFFRWRNEKSENVWSTISKDIWNIKLVWCWRIISMRFALNAKSYKTACTRGRGSICLCICSISEHKQLFVTYID